MLTIPTHSHTGQTLVAAINSPLQSAFRIGMCNTVYNDRRGTRTLTEATAAVSFLFFTIDGLAVNDEWQGVVYDKKHSQYMGGVLRNSGTTKVGSTFESSFVYLRNVHNWNTWSTV